MPRIVIYEENESYESYELSTFMQTESSLFKTIFEEGEEGESRVHLSMYHNEFRLLNFGTHPFFTVNTSHNYDVETINNLYEVFGYFGLDCLIKTLNEHVYYLEMSRIPESVIKCGAEHWFKKISKTIMCINNKLSVNFFKRYPDVITYHICKNTNIPEEFFLSHCGELDWDALSRNTNVSVAFIIKSRMYPLLMLDICSDSKYPEEFFERRIRDGTINWYNLCRNKGMSEEFFEKYLPTGKLEWSALSENTGLSEKFFERHIDLVDWRYLAKNKNMSEEFFERYIPKDGERGSIAWINLCQNENISESFFERYITGGNSGKIYWMFLCENKNISEAFFERYKNMIPNWQCFARISKYAKLSEEFIERNSEIINWNNLCANESIPEEFFEKCITEGNRGKIKWSILSCNSNISEAFFERHIDLVDVQRIKENRNVSLEFICKHFPEKIVGYSWRSKINLPKNKYKYNQWLNLV